MPKALITGVTGQDGSYLAELLLSKGYEVVGVVRRTSHHSYERIEHLLDRIEVVAADLLDQHSLTVVLQETQPDEVYNLDPFEQMLDPFVAMVAGSPHHPDYLIPLGEQQLRQIGAVLPRDPGDQCFRHKLAPGMVVPSARRR